MMNNFFFYIKIYFSSVLICIQKSYEVEVSKVRGLMQVGQVKYGAIFLVSLNMILDKNQLL